MLSLGVVRTVYKNRTGLLNRTLGQISKNLINYLQAYLSVMDSQIRCCGPINLFCQFLEA